MKRRIFLKSLGYSSPLLALPQLIYKKNHSSKKPNIIIILADDLGYVDVSFNHGGDIATPNIDTIAHQGTRFTNGFASHPFCSPSRAGLLTGRYQHRFGHECNPAYDPGNTDLGLPKSEILLSTLLKEAGYVTGIIGKWHLGSADVFHPNKRDFKEFYGFLHGQHDYFKSNGDGKRIFLPLLHNKELQPHPGYLTEAFTNEAVDFIRGHKDSPFFLFLSYNAPHSPLQATKKYLDQVRDIEDKNRRIYTAMVHALDEGIGKVLSALKQYSITENSLVFFLSDNGGDLSKGACNGSLRGGKISLYEGGLRIPFALMWPGMLPQNIVYNNQIISLDIFTTIAAAAGIELSPDREYDGVNLIPYLLEEKQGFPHDRLFWRIDNGSTYAVREQTYKMIVNKKPQKIELFDIKADPFENRDISKEKPDEVIRLFHLIQDWEKKMIEPLWPSQAEYLRMEDKK